MPTDKRRTELVAEEWNAFLDDCWERGEAPAGGAWKVHLRLAAITYLSIPKATYDESEELSEDLPSMRAWHARQEALRTMRTWTNSRRRNGGTALHRAPARAGLACQTCGGHGRLHVHHWTYERRGEESVDDLVVLSEDCHLAVHASGGSH